MACHKVTRAWLLPVILVLAAVQAPSLADRGRRSAPHKQQRISVRHPILTEEASMDLALRLGLDWWDTALRFRYEDNDFFSAPWPRTALATASWNGEYVLLMLGTSGRFAATFRDAYLVDSSEHILWNRKGSFRSSRVSDSGVVATISALDSMLLEICDRRGERLSRRSWPSHRFRPYQGRDAWNFDAGLAPYWGFLPSRDVLILPLGAAASVHEISILCMNRDGTPAWEFCPGNGGPPHVLVSDSPEGPIVICVWAQADDPGGCYDRPHSLHVRVLNESGSVTRTYDASQNGGLASVGFTPDRGKLICVSGAKDTHTIRLHPAQGQD